MRLNLNVFKMADIQKLNVNSTTYDISVPWSKVTGKPSTFDPSSHSHNYLPTDGNQYLNTVSGAIRSYNGQTGWHRLAKIKNGSYGYGNYELFLNGSWSYMQNTTAIIHINTTHTSGYITQVSGYVGFISKIRIVNITSNEYYVDVYIKYTGANTPGTVWYTFLSNGSVVTKDYGNKITDTVTATAEISLRQGGFAHYATTAGSAPASDVYAWAKAASKPSYTYSEVGAAPTSHSHNYIPLAGGSLSTSTSQISRGGSSTSWYLGRSNAMLKISSYSGYNAITSMKTTNGDWSMGVYTNDVMYFTYVTDSNFNAGNNTTTAQIYFNPSGYVYASAFYQTSDERLKTFHDPIRVDLEKLKKLRKNYFKFNDKDKLEIGVSAQEIQSLYPELVSSDDNGYLSVAYDKLSVIALAALDEQQKEIDDLKDQLSTIKNILKEKGIL